MQWIENENLHEELCVQITDSVQSVCANIKLSFKLSRTEFKMHDEHGEAKKLCSEAFPLRLQDLEI